MVLEKLPAIKVRIHDGNLIGVLAGFLGHFGVKDVLLAFLRALALLLLRLFLLLLAHVFPGPFAAALPTWSTFIERKIDDGVGGTQEPSR